MSIIYITEHNEKIQDIIKPEAKTEKRSSYKAILSTPDNYEIAIKKKYGTMGPPSYTPPNPRNFLRKKVKKPPMIKKKTECTDRECVEKMNRPSVPSHLYQKQDREKQQNFIKSNVINLLKKTFPKKEARFIDTRTGEVHKVEKSGLEPHYLKSRTFGKPPTYLLRRVEDRKRVVQAHTDKKDLNTLSSCHYITRQEREDLLNGLKHNWEEMQKNYQLLPIVTDTTPKILKKTKMEQNLKELEKDINLIEKHPYIYINEGESET